MKMIMTDHEDVLNYIHERWKLEVNKQPPKFKIRKGRPRVSRRHRG
jgi:hypothetical protein